MRRNERIEVKGRIERLKKNLRSRSWEFSNRKVIKENIKKLEKRLNAGKTKKS